MRQSIIANLIFTGKLPNDWYVKVEIFQNREGKILNIKFLDDNVGNGSIAKTYKNAIRRAINKSSPLPVAPEESVWDKQIIFTFEVQ